MQYISRRSSPLGGLLLFSDGDSLTGLYFEDESKLPASACEKPELRIFEETGRWLDIYFSGREPDFMPPLRTEGSPFRLTVWELLRRIPYGSTVTYGELASELAARRGMAKMSAQAVGGAVGRNAISILIPCHRVVGSGGRLTGYAGGLDKKAALLRLEGASISENFIQKEVRI